MISSTLASVTLVDHFARAPRLFYRMLPLSFAVYARERWLPVLAFIVLLSLPLALPLGILSAASLPGNLAAAFLVGAAAAALGESRPTRRTMAAIAFFLMGLTLGYFSFSGPLFVFAGLFAAALVLTVIARTRFYRDEVVE